MKQYGKTSRVKKKLKLLEVWLAKIVRFTFILNSIPSCTVGSVEERFGWLVFVF